MAAIYPSLISSDLLNLEQTIKSLDPYCPGYHLDVMDYHFVPNLTWGPQFLHAIAKATSGQLWIHLMVDNPGRWVEELRLPPETILSFHFETIGADTTFIKLIQKKMLLPSIAISPKTNVDEIFSVLNVVSQVVVMSVEPGFSGQPFLQSTISKIEALTDYRHANELQFSIAVDGGINEKNIKALNEIGVDHFAVASGIFSAKNPVEQLKKLNGIIQYKK